MACMPQLTTLWTLAAVGTPQFHQELAELPGIAFGAQGLHADPRGSARATRVHGLHSRRLERSRRLKADPVAGLLAHHRDR